MTKKEAVLISAYTGYMLTKNFAAVHGFIEETLGRHVYTHELVSHNLTAELQEKLKPQIIELVQQEE